jgi:hypothetical protein
MIIKKLNKKQIKCAEFLVEFDFKIAYQSEKKNDKADALTRRFNDRSIDESNDKQRHMHQILLSSKKVDFRILQKINDIETNNAELQLFDRIKNVNQTNANCIDIKSVLKRNKKD